MTRSLSSLHPHTTGPLLLAALALVLGYPLTGRDPGPAHAHVDSAAPAATGETVRAGNTLYLSGHMGIDPATGRVPEDSAAEARQLMENLRRTVTASGLQMDDLVSVTVISTDQKLTGVFDAVYRSYFHGRGPARSDALADALKGGAHFEILGVAVHVPRLPL
ncbi:MAG: RidA family protein [Proteobacteria bacterium]|nr:RidA family protein [Pseudomonadota bacterium]